MSNLTIIITQIPTPKPEVTGVNITLDIKDTTYGGCVLVGIAK